MEDLMDRTPPAAAALEDIQPFEPWFATITPGDYTANRELMRRVLSYLAAVELAAQDPQLRFAARRANRRILALGIGLAGGVAVPKNAPAAQESAPAAEPPPYRLQAPAIDNVPEAERQIASELQSRYEAVAAQAATAWQSAEIIRRNLRARKMELNVRTEVSLSRTKLYLETACDSLRGKAWPDARLNIGRAEYEIGKVLAVVGR